MTDVRMYDKWEDIDGKCSGNYKRKSAYCTECGITVNIDGEGCCVYCGREFCSE